MVEVEGEALGRPAGRSGRSPNRAGACAELRGLYEPFLIAMGRYFGLPVPPILADGPPVDNWQTSAWMRKAAGLGRLAGDDPRDDHGDE